MRDTKQGRKALKWMQAKAQRGEADGARRRNTNSDSAGAPEKLNEKGTVLAAPTFR